MGLLVNSDDGIAVAREPYFTFQAIDDTEIAHVELT
jgi:hypothetical protein